MSRSFNGSTNYLSASGISISDTPFTMSVWWKSKGLGSASPVGMCIGESGTGNNWFLWRLNTNKFMQIEEKDTVAGPGNSTQAATNDFSTWHLGVCVFSSHSSRSVFIDGTGKATVSGARTATGFNMTVVGANSVPGNLWNGNLAHAAIWNTDLTDQQVYSLLYLYPNQVAVGNLVNYWPMTGNQSPEPDYGSGNLPLTVTGATFSTDNPNIAGTLVQTLMGASG